jgi:methionyl-tRNA formyltransferase
MKIAFFGTPDLAVNALLKMESLGLVPSLVVTTPDAPIGRKQIITPPPTKVWAAKRKIPVFQPTSLKNPDDLATLTNEKWDVFVVFAYGKILPEWLLNLPKYGTINAHPSLLPKFRGASPIRSTLLHDLSACGVSIIQMDAGMDSGPILYQQSVQLDSPIPGKELDNTLSLICGDLLTHVIQELPKGNIESITQNHEAATFCTKITKEMAELALDPYTLPSGPEAYKTYCKICAFDGWPETFFIHEGKRFKIKAAHLNESGELVITRIVPEGKNEVDFKSYFSK